MRAPSAGIRLTRADAGIVKGMLVRGDRQSDIASFFGVNGGRIAEISVGKTFSSVAAAPPPPLPPAGPYVYGDLHRRTKQQMETIRDHLANGDTKNALDVVTNALKRL